MSHHMIKPTVFYNTLASHKPILTINDGDCVSTTTLDAAGNDADSQTVGHGPNPLTGPFFVTGAEPGDTIAITFNKIEPNRDTGFTRAAIAPLVLDPGCTPGLPDHTEKIQWEIDKEEGLITPLGVGSHLKNMKLPMQTMLGCFGVAPPRGQAIWSATSGAWGGNMDYNGFTAGVTVFFPVFIPGALLFIGDGHARQGDGEITGTGVEVSCNVTFTVRLVKDQIIQWPRAENKTHLMTIGNARPLDQCVQHATTEMASWLEKGFRLDARSVHILMGQTVQYDLANMFDPAYTMVCKMSKEILKEAGIVFNEIVAEHNSDWNHDA